MGKLKSILKGLKLSHLAPETPAIANMLTGEVMGHSADRLADRFGISRADQDAFAARSHQNAAKVHPSPNPDPDPNPNPNPDPNPDPDPTRSRPTSTSARPTSASPPRRSTRILWCMALVEP